MVAQEGQILLRGLNHYRDAAASLNEDILFSLANQASIIICKFLEVWNSTGRHAKTDTRLVPRRRAVQPIVDRISVWKGLDLFRNCTLAHPYVTSDGKLVAPKTIIRQYGVPSYHAEVILLLRLVHYAVLVFLSGFQEEFLSVWPLDTKDATRLDPSPGIENGRQIDPELQRVLALTDALLVQGGITIDQAFGREFESRLKAPGELR